MSFNEGQAVIHPFLGPARVLSVSTRQLAGESIDYVQLEVLRDGMQLGIPLAKADEIGMRPVCTRERIDELFDVLRGPSTVETGQWARRIKDLNNRLATGDIEEICVVVRDIKRADKAGGTEAALLRNASERVALEFSLALGIDAEEALELIFEAVLAGDDAADTSDSAQLAAA